MHAPGQLLNWSCERYYWKYVASYICFKRNSLNKNKKHINVYEYFGMLKMYWKLIIEVWYYVRSRIFFQCVSLVYSTWCNIDVSIKHFLCGGGKHCFFWWELGNTRKKSLCGIEQIVSEFEKKYTYTNSSTLVIILWSA